MLSRIFSSVGTFFVHVIRLSGLYMIVMLLIQFAGSSSLGPDYMQ